MPFTNRLQEIRTGFERPFWIANISEIFERLSYYGAFSSLAVYLQEKLNFSTEQTGTLTGIFGGMVWFLAIFGGAIADRLGFRRRLAGMGALMSLGAGPAAAVSASWAGAAIVALNTGPVAQPGIDYTIITSRYDELVTPTETSFIREPGVHNRYVQDSCPFDPVGHIGEAYDLNVWHLVRNALDPAHAAPIRICAVGSPG